MTTEADHKEPCASLVHHKRAVAYSIVTEKLFYKRELIWPEKKKPRKTTKQNQNKHKVSLLLFSFLFLFLLSPPFSSSSAFFLLGGGGVAPTCVYKCEGQRYLPQLTCLGPVRLQVVGLVCGGLYLQVSSRVSVSCFHFDALDSVKQSPQ